MIGLANDLDFFKPRVELFLALAPCVNMKNTYEPLYKQSSEMGWLWDEAISLGYVEVGSNPENHPDKIQDDDWICWASP